jgi:hypothetical protein
MPASRTKTDVLEAEFLPLRAKILEIAAGLDRLDRAEGALGADQRAARLRQAIELLLTESSDRAEQVQRHFSREFDDAWRDEFGL